MGLITILTCGASRYEVQLAQRPLLSRTGERAQVVEPPQSRRPSDGGAQPAPPVFWIATKRPVFSTVKTASTSGPAELRGGQSDLYQAPGNLDRNVAKSAGDELARSAVQGGVLEAEAEPE